MELTKEDFCHIIKELQENIETCDRINDTISASSLRYLRDWFDAFCLIGPYENTIVKLLEIIMNDEDQWIEYFMDDCDFGKNDRYNVIVIEDRPFKLDCVESLWELLQLTK